MEKAQIGMLETRLLREREGVVKALRQLDESVNTSDADGDLTTYPLHLADEGTDTMEQEQAFLLLSNEGRTLVGIDDALRRLYSEPEKFGTCAGCGEAIAPERLELVPWALHCVECQSAQEERAAGESGQAA